MEEKKMTLKDVLKMIAGEIEAIQVPVSLADQIARPLCRNVSLLRSVIEQMKDEAPEAGQEGDENVQG